MNRMWKMLSQKFELVPCEETRVQMFLNFINYTNINTDKNKIKIKKKITL